MGVSLKQSGNFGVRKNQVIFHEGQNTNSINVLLQGQMDVFLSPFDNLKGISEAEMMKKSFRIFSVNHNLFIGPNDLCTTKKYSFTYLAAEDSVLYGYMTDTLEQAKVLIDVQKEYAACMVTSIFNIINYSYQALKKIENFAKDLHSLTENLILYFWALKEEYGFSEAPATKYFREGLDHLQKMRDMKYPIQYTFNPTFFETNHGKILESDELLNSEVNPEKIKYYQHISDLPMELQRDFFSEDMVITQYHCTEMANCLSDVQSSLKDTFVYANQIFSRLYSENEDSIFSEYVNAAKELKKNNQDTTTILQVIEFMVEKINSVVALYEGEYRHPCELDKDYLNNILNQIKLSTANTKEVNGKEQATPEELQDSAMKILEYSRIPQDKANTFWEALESFRRLKDKLSTEDYARTIRGTISSLFFDVYEGVYKRVVAEKDQTRIYQMFLQFGYMDERLLTPEQVMDLYKLAGRQPGKGTYPILSIKDWLNKIYDREREPSINEFGQDYSEVFKDGRKRRDISDKDQLQSENDIDAKVKFEIFNMFKINQRVCHGQISVYFPILHSEMITRDLSRAYITQEMIDEAIEKIVKIDYSVFHREISYRNPEKGIEKEFIMKSVIPDIIMMPTFGSRPVMWQEISGRNRSTPARFILPAFTTEKLEDMILKIIGNFRWELCRTMMGVSWNDITVKSLTSEYSDYIQFYRKNRELSDELKEKIRAQTVKYRNMTREIFTADYELWINYESKGNIRLNKVVRGIFYKHCPFVKPIREFLEKQPMYTDMAIQFKNLKMKQAKEIENRYNKFIKAGSELDPECAENLRFYKDL